MDAARTALGIGLIGCGRAAEHLHLPALMRTDGARLVAVVDPLRERREAIAAGAGGCASFSEPEALLAAPDVEAVIVATPPELHAAVALQCLRAGKPVLVEKPLAASPAEVRPLEAQCAERPVPLMLGFNRRFWTPVRHLREALHRAPPGEAWLARLVMTTDMTTWSPVCGAQDALDDLGSHQLDLLRCLFDRPVEAVAARSLAGGSLELHVALAGVRAECQLLQGGDPREVIRVEGTKHAYEVHLGSEQIRPAAGPWRAALDVGDAVKRRLTGRVSSLRDSYAQQLAAFVHCVRSGEAPEPGLADGVAAVEAVAAARASLAAGGREIEVSR